MPNFFRRGAVILPSINVSVAGSKATPPLGVRARFIKSYSIATVAPMGVSMLSSASPSWDCIRKSTGAVPVTKMEFSGVSSFRISPDILSTGPNGASSMDMFLSSISGFILEMSTSKLVLRARTTASTRERFKKPRLASRSSTTPPLDRDTPSSFSASARHACPSDRHNRQRHRMVFLIMTASPYLLLRIQRFFSTLTAYDKDELQGHVATYHCKILLFAQNDNSAPGRQRGLTSLNQRPEDRCLPRYSFVAARFIGPVSSKLDRYKTDPSDSGGLSLSANGPPQGLSLRIRLCRL